MNWRSQIPGLPKNSPYTKLIWAPTLSTHDPNPPITIQHLGTPELTESIAVADSQTATVVYAAEITESFSPADVSRYSYDDTQVETAAIADTQTATADFSAVITETVALAELSGTETSADAEETVTPGDSATAGVSTGAALTESAALSDSQTGTVPTLGNVTETLSVSDEQTGQVPVVPVPNTRDTAPTFVALEPDWKEPVTLWQKWETYLDSTWSGFEQRAARRHQPLYEQVFKAKPLNADEWPRRRAELLAEFSGPIVVPLWPWADQVASIVDDVLTLDLAILTGSPYKVGSYLYFDADTPCFRKIIELTSTTITLAAGNAAYPDIVPPVYDAGTRVIPCIVGIRKENRGQWEHEELENTSETVHAEETGPLYPVTPPGS